MKKRFHYVDESDDLKLARQKDAEAYREFIRENNLESLRGRWSIDAFNHLYDAPREVAA